MHARKTIGTFVPLSSLPNGTINDGLIFLDWLKKTGQSAWQMLPLHETQLKSHSKTEHVASPYKSYGVGLDPRYGSPSPRPSPLKGEGEISSKGIERWLPDYSLFCALRDHFGTDNWTLWDKKIRLRNHKSIEEWREKLKDQVYMYTWQQLSLHNDYEKLREKAKEKNVALIGDLPFYIPLNSPLVWMYQHVFQINEDGTLPRASGVVNEPKATYGRQVWGHPLYRWEIPALHPDIIKLFTLRLHYLSELFDQIRIDHANGFFLYGAIDPHSEKNDKIRTGPGFTVFKTIVQASRELNLCIFAEDAAVELQNLRSAMQMLHIPGIRILRYAYNEKIDLFEKDYVRISDYPKYSVAYTTTHDTETLMGWAEKLDEKQKLRLLQKLGITTEKPITDNRIFALNLRQAVINSPAQTVIIPIQDWLLSTERINTPGTENESNDPNWQFKLPMPIEQLPLL